MGCYDSKIAFEKHTEQTYLLPFEDKLGYRSIPAKEFDNILHRYSLSGLMTYSQFTRALTTAGVNFHKLDGFYKHFIKESNSNKFEKRYQTSRLNSLGILLSKDTIEAKSQILFQTYDTQAKKILGLDTVLYMLDNLITVALSVIPEYCIANTRIKDDLVKYSSYLEIAKNQVLENFFKSFPHPKTGLPFKEFSEAFTNETTAKLLNSKKLRLYAYKIGVSLESTDLKLKKYLMAKTGDARISTTDTEEKDLEEYILKYTSRHPFSSEKRPIMLPLLKIVGLEEDEVESDEQNGNTPRVKHKRSKSGLFRCELSSIRDNEEELGQISTRLTVCKVKKIKRKRLKKNKGKKDTPELGFTFLLNTLDKPPNK